MPLDLKQIEKFRKDFLMLMKNAKVVKDYDQAIRWKEAVERWSAQLDRFLDRIDTTLSDLKLQERITKQESEHWKRTIRRGLFPVSTLDVPVYRYDLDYIIKYEPGTTKQDLFGRMQRRLRQWESKKRREARTAWKVLKEFARWYEERFQTPLALDIPVEERVSLEGFPTAIKGFPTRSSDLYEDFLVRFKAGLKLYKRRARQVLPLLLRAQLPLVVDFTMGLDEGGLYENSYISINPTSAKKNPAYMAHFLAHEMGHHLYRNYLSNEDEEFWSRAIKGNYGTLDLNDVVRRYGGDKDFFDNRRIKKEDPILYLQIDALWVMPESKQVFDNILFMDKLKKYLAEGGDAKWRVHGKPITGYAHKNPEEAFCEALGMLVAYGPQAVLPEVREWLKTILPQIKISAII